MARIYAPESDFSGTSVGVTFTNGEAVTENERAVEYFIEAGYEVECDECGEPHAIHPEPEPEPEDTGDAEQSAGDDSGDDKGDDKGEPEAPVTAPAETKPAAKRKSVREA